MEYEVFLSFRGPDTRDNFTSCLYYDMVEKGIRVFKDDNELRVSQKIERGLLQALEDSQIYIPIFSKGFASSAWCLREVAYMVNCTSKSHGKKEILPVFFDVKPDDVKLRTNLYKDALSEHEKEYYIHEVKRWRNALVEVPTRVGWRLEGKGYGELIKLIVREVLLKLKVKNRSLPDNLVEMDDEEDIEELLKVDSADHVHFVIIYGTGGIGKTTLAKVIFNRFESKFDYSSFLEDVQDLSQRHGLLHVQKKLLSDTLGSTSTNEIHDTNDGIDRIRKGLSNKKVLVVVDNVNEKKQLENVAGSHTWFGSGSRIIITVRDRRIVLDKTILDEDNKTRPNYYMDHPVKEMPLDRAIQLFSKHAFRSNTPPEDCHSISEEVVSSIGRLPLTLEVVGSLLARTVKSKWDETLKDLKQVPPRHVRDTLMISFNKLDYREKAIFLDIACFCVGESRMNAIYMWDDCGYSPHSVIEDLLLMSLIKIDKDNKFWMHDEVRDLGRYIVKEENFEDAGKRRWVWIDDNTLDILRSDEEKRTVRALSLGISRDLTPKELACLPQLRFLGGKRMNFVGDFKNLLHNLKWLSWRDSKLALSAKNLHPMNLVVLDLSQSNITYDWGGWRQIKMAKKLKVLDLTGCFRLTKTPDFSEFGKLEKLILTDCSNLSMIDSSIGKLKLLSTLNILGCDSLKELPEEIGSLDCLSEIIMPSFNNIFRSCCEEIIFLIPPFKLPDTLGNLKSLTEFRVLHNDDIWQLPHSIERLVNLVRLSLHGCRNLHMLPDSIGQLESLVTLDLQHSGIIGLPDSMGNLKRLEFLWVGHTFIREIPHALGGLEMLKELDASHCLCLAKIPGEIVSLPRLWFLDLMWTKISTLPTEISRSSSLQRLMISGYFLRALPELPLSLKGLLIEAAEFPILPDLSSLVHLENFHVQRMPPIFSFMTRNGDILPWEDAQSINTLPRNLSTLLLGSIPQLPNYSDFKSLSYLRIEVCPMPHFHTLKYLEKLNKLYILACKFLESTPDLSLLKRLQDLQLYDLPRLTDVPGLGELESLRILCITKCNAIEQLPNFSKLKNLWHLKLDKCKKMKALEGLKELNSLKTVEIKKCISLKILPDVPGFSRLKTDRMPLEAAGRAIQSTVSRNRLPGIPIRAPHVRLR